jgi:hypothetical protein
VQAEEILVGKRDKRHPKKSDAQMAREDRQRMITTGRKLIMNNSGGFLLYYIAPDGSQMVSYSQETFALGALEKIRRQLED